METVGNKNKLTNIGIAISLGAAFFLLYLLGGYGIAGDSASYMTMEVNREPLYPLLLWLFRKIFGAGEDFYAPLAFFQNTLAAVATCVTAGYLGTRIFKSNLGKWMSALMLLLPHLMTPVFSRSHMVLTNKIMAEGITISLYYLFVIFLMKIIYEKEGFLKNELWSAFFVFLLVITKGQMMVVIVLWAVVCGGRQILEKHWKGLPGVLCGMAVLFLGTSVFSGLYHLSNSGIYTATVSSKPMIVANALYVSERSDGEQIEDEKLRQLFFLIYDSLERDGLLAANAPSGILARAHHHEDSHDAINFNYFVPEKNNVYVDQMGSTYSEFMIFEEKIAGELTKELLKNNWPRYLKNYVAVCTLGFIRSVSVDKGLLSICAAVIYVLGILVIGLSVKKNGWTRNVMFLITIYIAIIGFVLGTSLIIQCITRYVIYNLPFFYLAGLAVLLEVLPGKWKSGKEE